MRARKRTRLLHRLRTICTKMFKSHWTGYWSCNRNLSRLFWVRKCFVCPFACISIRRLSIKKEPLAHSEVNAMSYKKQYSFWLFHQFFLGYRALVNDPQQGKKETEITIQFSHSMREEESQKKDWCVFWSFFFVYFPFWFARPRALNEVCLQLFSMATDDRNHIYLFSCQFRHENTDVIKPTTHCAHRDYVIFCQSFVEKTQWTKRKKNTLTKVETDVRAVLWNRMCISTVSFFVSFCRRRRHSRRLFYSISLQSFRVFFLSIEETNALHINSRRVQCSNATNKSSV